MSKVQRTVAATHQEICKANLLVNIDLEQVGSSKGAVDLTDQKGKRAVTLADDCIKDEPVFMVRNGKRYRLRIGLAHKHQSDAVKFKICSVSMKLPDDTVLVLDIVESKPPSEGSEVVAWFQTDMFERSKHRRRRPQFGTVEEKYVKVVVKIVVDVAANEATKEKEGHIEMIGRIWCLPVSRFSPIMNIRKFSCFTSEKWRNSPQWMRDAGRGAVFLMNVGLTATVLIEPAAITQAAQCIF